MATRNIVPRGDGEGTVGTSAKKWGGLWAEKLNNAKVGDLAASAGEYRQPSTSYTVGAIAKHAALPAGYYLECTTAGTTSSGDLSISSPAIGDTVTDGTVTWTVSRDLPLIGGGALTGTTLTWNGADLGGASIVAQSLGAIGYVKYSNGLIIQWGGASTSSNTSINVGFPISFTTIGRVMSSSNDGGERVTSVTTTGFTLLSAQYTDNFWFAIGY